jgi:hypothetical protein
MTTATSSAKQLSQTALRLGAAGLPRRFYTAASKLIDAPWSIAVGMRESGADDI